MGLGVIEGSLFSTGDHRKLLLQCGGVVGNSWSSVEDHGKLSASVDTMRNPWSGAGVLVRPGEEGISGLGLEG